jgi:hypothetical protein
MADETSAIKSPLGALLIGPGKRQSQLVHLDELPPDEPVSLPGLNELNATVVRRMDQDAWTQDRHRRAAENTVPRNPFAPPPNYVSPQPIDRDKELYSRLGALDKMKFMAERRWRHEIAEAEAVRNATIEARMAERRAKLMQGEPLNYPDHRLDPVIINAEAACEHAIRLADHRHLTCADLWLEDFQ